MVITNEILSYEARNPTELGQIIQNLGILISSKSNCLSLVKLLIEKLIQVQIELIIAQISKKKKLKKVFGQYLRFKRK